jgi:hypothetical protein
LLACRHVPAQRGGGEFIHLAADAIQRAPAAWTSGDGLGRNPRSLGIKGIPRRSDRRRIAPGTFVEAPAEADGLRKLSQEQKAWPD